MKRTLSVLLAALVCAGLLAACGSASSTTTSGSAAASSASAGGSSARTKLAACLKAHGVTLPARPAGAARRRPPGGYGGGYGGGGGGGFFFGGGHGGPGAGGGPGRFRSNPKLQSAFRACAGSFPRRRAFSGAARQAAVTKFVTCVRQHGYNLPKPNFSGKGSVFPAKIATNAKFQAAAKSCMSALRPQGAPGAPGGPPGGASGSSGGSGPAT